MTTESDGDAYCRHLADPVLRAAFVEFATGRGLSLETYGPHQAWNNGMTVLWFAAYADAWVEAGGRPPTAEAIGNPRDRARDRVVCRWYESEVRDVAARLGRPMPPWSELDSANRALVQAEYQALQQDMNALGASLSPP